MVTCREVSRGKHSRVKEVRASLRFLESEPGVLSHHRAGFSGAVAGASRGFHSQHKCFACAICSGVIFLAMRSSPLTASSCCSAAARVAARLIHL